MTATRGAQLNNCVARAPGKTFCVYYSSRQPKSRARRNGSRNYQKVKIVKKQVIVAALALLIAGSILLAHAAAGNDAEIRVLCSNAIKAAVEKLLPEAERTIGRHISIQFSASTVLRKAIDAGEPFDVAMLTPGIIDDLIKSGKIVSGSHTDIASADLAAGVRAGASKADISTPAAMKRRLLAAQTITWTDGGASATAIVAMLKGLGIEEQLQSKIVLQKVPGRAAASVAGGENEIALAPVSEIQTVKGVEVLGFFPKEYQSPVVVTAGLAAKAKDTDAARALLKFLTSSKAVPAIKSSGMTPVATK
jgi:molybdate transport system substrate-binding protein